MLGSCPCGTVLSAPSRGVQVGGQACTPQPSLCTWPAQVQVTVDLILQFAGRLYGCVIGLSVLREL